MNDSRCLIYFIGAGDFVKIGKTTSSRLYKRFSQIQNGCPFYAEILAVVEVPSQVFEQEIHRRLSASRERGEWFRRTDAAVQKVIELAKKHQGSSSESWRVVMAGLPEVQPAAPSDPWPIKRPPNPRHFRLTPGWVLAGRRQRSDPGLVGRAATGGFWGTLQPQGDITRVLRRLPTEFQP